MNEPVTDRELLELAARAARIGPLDFDYAKRESHGIYFGPRLPMPQGVLMAAMHEYWNPLTDDGDALRLAVKLGMEVFIDNAPGGCECTEAQSHTHKPSGRSIYNHDAATDQYQATRRAITRAAAEIGRGLATNPDSEKKAGND